MRLKKHVLICGGWETLCDADTCHFSQGHPCLSCVRRQFSGHSDAYCEENIEFMVLKDGILVIVAILHELNVSVSYSTNMHMFQGL